jgi:integrase
MSRPDDTKRGRWPLLEGGYAPATVKKYKRAVHRFLNWCLTTQQDAETTEELDELLSDYFQQMHDDNGGAGKSVAVATLQGIKMYMPRIKADSALPIASTISARWNKSKPSISYPPLTWELAVAIACQMARAGHFRFGVATLVSFVCLLRVGEMASMRRENFADGCDVRLGAEYQQAVVSIDKAKTGRFQSVEVKDEQVKTLLMAVVAETKPGQLLFPGGAAAYRRVFKETCASLGLSSKYVPHSLRHGGATRLYLQHVPLEDILMRGRWKSTMSARTYVQSGRAMLMAMQVPDRVAKAGLVLARDVVTSMALTQKHK